LRRTHGRDKPRDTDLLVSALSEVEITILDTIVNAFVKGLYKVDLRREANRCDTASCGAL
jgi:hypothetical protein